MSIPALDSIDPGLYPMSVADWRESSQYSHHNEDAALWAWEFVRRRCDFQLLTDIRDATDVAQRNDGFWLSEDPDIAAQQQLDMHRRKAEIRRIRLPEEVVSELRRYPEFDEELTRMRERGQLSENHERKVGFGHVVARSALLRLFPQFREPAGWRNEKPWLEIPGMDRPPILDPEIHRYQMPPWPVKWYGDNLVPDNDFRMSIAYMDATSIEAYTRAQTVYFNTDEETGAIEPPDGNDEVLRVLYGQAVGSVIDFGKCKEYHHLISSDERKADHMAHMAFDLSAPINTQLVWAGRYLEAMRDRAIAAGILAPEEQAEKLPTRPHGVWWLRYLDYECDSEKCSRAEFQRMLGWNESDSTRWRRLCESALKYRDDIGPRLCDYRKPLPKNQG